MPYTERSGQYYYYEARPMRLVEVYTDTNIEILEDIHGKPLRVGGEFQLADVKNANGRIYTEALWKRALSQQKTMSRLKERRMVGELDHPSSGKTSVRNISHVMTEISMRESTRFPGKLAVYGVYETVPTPDGKILEALHRSRIGVAVSSRGDGDLEERGGDSYVIPESYELDTWDAVMDPSVNVTANVLESMAAATQSSTCTLKKALGGKAVESLVKAIYAVVESGDFDKDTARYYKQILENVDDNGNSETYLLAQEALAELTEHLEVTKVMKTPTAGLPEASASGLTPEQVLMAENTELKTKLAAAEARASAGQRLVSELLIQARSSKMQAESNLSKWRQLDGIAEKYESAKQLIVKLREAVQSLQNEGKLRIAAERLLGAFLSKFEEAKRVAYVDRMLVKESVKTRQELRPILLECESKSAVNKILIRFKGAVTEARTSRGLPPVNEGGKRTTRIPAQSPLMESNDDKQKAGTEAATPQLQEQVDFTKRLVKSIRG